MGLTYISLPAIAKKFVIFWATQQWLWEMESTAGVEICSQR
jgi:hypothetical protein